jgi:hypothetical protein
MTIHPITSPDRQLLIIIVPCFLLEASRKLLWNLSFKLFFCTLTPSIAQLAEATEMDKGKINYKNHFWLGKSLH